MIQYNIQFWNLVVCLLENSLSGHSKSLKQKAKLLRRKTSKTESRLDGLSSALQRPAPPAFLFLLLSSVWSSKQTYNQGEEGRVGGVGGGCTINIIVKYYYLGELRYTKGMLSVTIQSFKIPMK